MSISGEQEGRLQDFVEGTAPPDEAAATRAWLAASAPGRERERELRETFDALGALALEEAPAGLSAAVMARVAAEPRRAREPWFAGLGRALARRPALGFGYAFAAGLAAGAIALALATGVWRPASRAGLPVSATLAPARAVAPAETARLEAGAAAVSAALWMQAATTRLGLESAGREAGAVEITWDEAALAVASFHWSGAGSRRADSSPGRLVLDLAPGARCSIDFERRGAGGGALGVTLRGAAGEVHREFRAGAGGPGR